MLAALGLALTATSALAADGVIEINHVRALAGGITPGDAPGYPVTLAASGSFVLTSDLTLPDADTTGIEITADHVTIDLNGFGVVGPTVCSGEPLVCSPTGTGNGIDGYTAQARYATVLNGTVRGAGNMGVFLRRHSVIQGVRATDNAVHGIYSYGSALVVENTSVGNGSSGIVVVLDGNVVKDNVASENGSHGIWLISGGGTVAGNATANNGGYGLNLGLRTGWSGNAMSGNGSGEVNGTGVQLGANLCGSSTCP